MSFLFRPDRSCFAHYDLLPMYTKENKQHNKQIFISAALHLFTENITIIFVNPLSSLPQNGLACLQCDPAITVREFKNPRKRFDWTVNWIEFAFEFG